MADSVLVFSKCELLKHIFTFLSPKDLLMCRVVCLKWQRIIDTLTKDEVLWRKHCRRDYPDIYNSAHRKSQPRLSWYHVYRSLKLWPKLEQALVLKNEFAENLEHEINSFQVLRDGIIGVHREDSIVYYDLNTLQESQRNKISGSFFEYRENDDVILLHDYELHLLVQWKVTEKSKTSYTVTLNNVKLFLLAENDIYYVTVNEEIKLCQLVDGKITYTMVTKMTESVILLGLSDFLNIFTSRRSIFTLVGDELIHVKRLKSINIESLLHELISYNFLNQIEWKLMFPSIIDSKSCNQGVCPKLNYVLTTLFSYGSIVFTGSNLGHFKIYNTPNSDDLLKVNRPESLIHEYLLELHDCFRSSRCPIIRIDVVEGNDSHMVLLALLNKIVVFKFIHNLLTLSNEAA